MVIESSKSHTLHLPYRDEDGNSKRVSIRPGSNEIDDSKWDAVKEEMGERLKSYAKGLTIKGGK